MASLAPASLSVGLSYFTALFHERPSICPFLFFLWPFIAPSLSFYFSVSVIDMQQCVPGRGCRLCSHGRPLKQLGADSRVQNSCKHSGNVSEFFEMQVLLSQTFLKCIYDTLKKHLTWNQCITSGFLSWLLPALSLSFRLFTVSLAFPRWQWLKREVTAVCLACPRCHRPDGLVWWALIT